MNILITSVGSTTSISVIKALRKSEKNLIITGTDINEPHLCAGHQFVDNFIKTPPCTDTDSYIATIRDVVIDNQIDCLIPIHDLEIETISHHKGLLSKHTFIATNNPDIVNICNDKSLANEKAKLAGLLVPNTISMNASNQQVHFPLIAKPTRGVSSRDIMIIPDQGTFDKYKNNKLGQGYIIQEFIDGDEYTVDTYSDYNAAFYGAVVRKRIETKAGISTKGVTLKNKTLVEYCKALLNYIGFQGAANIQFIERDGLFYFIEINPRFSGAGILSYESGFNSPYFTLLSASGENLPSFTDLNIVYNLYMTRYWEESFHKEAIQQQ